MSDIWCKNASDMGSVPVYLFFMQIEAIVEEEADDSWLHH